MFKLLRYFSLTSLIAVMIVTTLLGVLYRQIAVNQLIELEESKNVALTRAFANTLWPEYASFLVGESNQGHNDLFPHPEIDQLDIAVKEQMSGLTVVKVKIYDLQGDTIFSTEAR